MFDDKEIQQKIDNGEEIDWYCISRYQKLSESFIEKHSEKVHWTLISANQKLSEDFIERHSEKVHWDCISKYQKLSEDFIERHSEEVYWHRISAYQNLSESFIERHSEKVDWNLISEYQKLSESFIERHSKRVDWDSISRYQKLSEAFIEKHSEKVHWHLISEYQKLSDEFREKHNLEKVPKPIGYEQYAKDNDLEISDGYLYAFREHDQHGRGMYKKSIFYEEGKRYEDWHCDLNPENENSFGLGIFSKGNAPVRVKVPEDWGTAVANDPERRKARVWAFEIPEKGK